MTKLQFLGSDEHCAQHSFLSHQPAVVEAIQQVGPLLFAFFYIVELLFQFGRVRGVKEGGLARLARDLAYFALVVASLPFTALDPGTAFRMWSVLELLLLVLAVWIAIRAGPWPARRAQGSRLAVLLMALAGGGTFAFLLLGQIDGFAALGLAAAYASWRGDRNALAGFWLGLAFSATKPHLAIGLGIWLLARRDWRALAGATTGCALVAAISLVLVGPSGIGAFVSALGFAYGNTPASSTLGVPGLVASWLGTGTLPSTLGVAGIVATGTPPMRCSMRISSSWARSCSGLAQTRVRDMISPARTPMKAVIKDAPQNAACGPAALESLPSISGRRGPLFLIMPPKCPRNQGPDGYQGCCA